MRRIGFWIGIAIWTASATLNAQEYRATLLGTVSDSSSATIAGAHVIVTNTATGIATSSEANRDGIYTVPFLLPGPYNLKVQQTGFNTFEQTAIELHANDQVRVDVTLQVGQAAETITVTSQTPLLDTAGANGGHVVGQEQLEDLPVHSLNPMEVLNLSTGVQYEGGLKFFRPYDQGSIEAYSINGGGESQNNYQLDGLPNNALTYYEVRPQVAYVPPLEAVQETKIMTNTYDAQYERTLGGVASIVTKSGTNQFHGAAYYAQRRSYLDANIAGNAGGSTPFDHVDQFGFEIAGPVFVPKLYHGRNRTFFMFAYEHYNDSSPQAAVGSIPTPLQRGGDFSQTLNASAQLITIYDPNTTRPNPGFDPSQPVTLSNPQYLRDPFPGNVIPSNRLNPVALKVLGDIPSPNSSGDPVTQLNNWLAPNVQSLDVFNNYVARVDHEVSENWRIFGRWDHSYRNGGTHNNYDWQTPARQYIQNLRQSDGVGLDAVGTLNPQTVVTGRIGYHRFLYSSNPFTQDLSYLGLPVTSQLQEPGLYPLMNFTNYIGTGLNQNDISPFEGYTAQGTMIKNIGRHTLKSGVEFNLEHFADVGRQNGQGVYNFTPGFTQQNPQVADPASGNAIASFLLGDMDSASVNLNAAPYTTWHNLGLFVQDDWQVNSRLTLNLGLRWDYLSPPYVRGNAQNRGFGFTAASPIQVSGLPPLKGGLLFAGVSRPAGAWDAQYSNWQPRLGFAYRVSPSGRLVLRGGVGRSVAPLNWLFGGNMGFAQATFSQTTTPGFQPLDTLSNPFPGGLIQPSGASLGLATNVGDGVQFTSPKWRNPYVWQYSLGFQYELTQSSLVDVSYVGSRLYNLGVSKEYDFLTPQQLSLGAGYLNQVVPNPFFGVLPANTALGASPTTIQASLLTPYPQFTNVTDTNNSIGRSWYNSLQVKGVQRFKHGVSLLVFWTYSKDIDATNYINPQDTALSHMLDSFDARHRFVISGIYQLPFGPGKKWLGHGIASHVIGGWQVSTTGVVQSGTPMANPSGYYINGDPKLSSGQSLQHWFNTSPQIWQPIPPYALSNVPLNSSTVRLPTAPQFDASLLRIISIREQHQLSLRLSAFNLTNSPFFAPPDTDPTSPLFGVVPQFQINRARILELGARYSF